MFRFQVVQALYLLLLVPLLTLFYLSVSRQRRRALLQFGRLSLIEKLTTGISRRRRVLKSSFVVAAVALLVVALARPQFGTRLRTVEREGQDLVVALDVSLSMLAEDIKPNRLEKARLAVGALIDLLAGDRIGLVGFAGEAFVQCPLTLDYGAAKMFLNAMDTDLVAVPGTALREAVEKALALLSKVEKSHKVLILITDGEDHYGNIDDVAAEASEQGVIVYAIGIGSAQGTPIPVYDGSGQRQGFKKDAQGNVVMTRLNEGPLRSLAEQTGGKFYRATAAGRELEEISEEIGTMEKKTLATQQIVQYEEQYQGFVALALVLLLLEFLLPESRKVETLWRGRFQ